MLYQHLVALHWNAVLGDSQSATNLAKLLSQIDQHLENPSVRLPKAPNDLPDPEVEVVGSVAHATPEDSIDVDAFLGTIDVDAFISEDVNTQHVAAAEVVGITA